jgi:hypothetical protein
MHRRKFIGVAGATLAGVAGTTYILTDTYSITRSDIQAPHPAGSPLHPEEKVILYLASLAPSGHNTQPWLVKCLAPFHWIIGNDKSRWLPAVDPTQRETVLSIRAFLQNLEYAAGHYGYSSQFDIVAKSGQDKNVVEVRLKKTTSAADYNIEKIRSRRTLRSGFKSDLMKKEDIVYPTGGDVAYLHYLSSGSKENSWLNEQTIEANRLQAARDAAQGKLSNWIRFLSKNEKKHCDGLTTASMEIERLSGLFVRNFYAKDDVMKKSFRDKGLDQVREQVAHSAGWMLIKSTGNSVALLIETGMRMQRLFLKVRSKGIALHPMTQILEEKETFKQVNTAIGITDPIQFLLRLGYVADYPAPVSLRRPVDWYVKI